VTAGAGPVIPCDAAGSVILSFTMSGTGSPIALGIYRDAPYVYGLFYRPNHLRKYTNTGSRVSKYTITGPSVPRGGDHAHLGSGYLSLVCPDTKRLYVFRTTGGAPVASFPASGTQWPMNNFYDGRYYYTNGPYDRNLWYRYTASGGSAGTWTSAFAGSTCGSGASTATDGDIGVYQVSCSWTAGQPTYVSDTSGSLIKSFALPGANSNGASCGPASDILYGTTYWCNRYTGGELVAMEVDLGTTAPVAPTSLGKIKTLYR
jgi:hypothetical protein